MHAAESCMRSVRRAMVANFDHHTCYTVQRRGSRASSTKTLTAMIRKFRRGWRELNVAETLFFLHEDSDLRRD